MKVQFTLLPLIIFLTILINTSTLFAQNDERPVEDSTAPAQTAMPDPNFPTQPNPIGDLITEIREMRSLLQGINEKLGGMSENNLSSDRRQSSAADVQQNRILLGIDIMNRAEQRSEALRKQLIELIDKENSLKTRLIQVQEDIRPENIERSTNAVGTTRTVELRESRRQALDNERRSLQNLVVQIEQSRIRLETDVQQADALVLKLRQRVLPIIENEIQNLDANQRR